MRRIKFYNINNAIIKIYKVGAVMKLKELRSEIDLVDSQIIDLIIKRRQLMNGVVEYKLNNNVPVFAPDREHQILDRVAELAGRDFGGSGVQLLYGILMDLNKLYEYQRAPKDISIPTDIGGASVRAVLSDLPGALSRYISPLAVAGVNIANIRSQSMPGGKLLVDLEIVGDTSDPQFKAALSVLSDTAENFVLM